MVKRGASTVAPPQPKPWATWRVRSFWPVLLLIPVLLGLGLVDESRFPLRQVQVTGDFRYLDPQRLQQVALPNIRGGFFSVDLQAVADALESLPWVKHASLRRQWPDGLLIWIEEQQPVAYWNDEALLNAEGDVFQPDTLPDDLAIPGFHGPADQSKETMNLANTLAAQLPNDERRLRSLKQDARGAVSVILDDGTEVLLGRSEVLARMQRFVQILPVLRDAGQVVERLDLRYPHGVAVRYARLNEPQEQREG